MNTDKLKIMKFIQGDKILYDGKLLKGGELSLGKLIEERSPYK